MADLVTELGKLKYGEGIRDILGQIGSSILEKKRTDEAQRTMSELTGVDLGTPEGLDKFRSAVFNLSQLGQPGKSGMEAVQQGVIEPMQFQQKIDEAKFNRLKNVADMYNKNVADYHQDLRNPNVTPETVKGRYGVLAQQRAQMLPQFKGQEQMLQTPEDPSSIQIDEKIGTKLQDTNGRQFVWGRKLDGTRGWVLAKDDAGNPIIAPPKSAGAGAAQAPLTPAGEDKIDFEKSGEDFLNTVSPARRRIVKAIGDFEMAPADVASLMRGNLREFYSAAALAYNPDWSMVDYRGKNDTVNYYRKNQGAKNLTSLNQAVDHAGRLYDAVEALENNDPKLMNWLKNTYRIQSGDKTASVNNFHLIADRVVEEMIRSFKGTSGTIPDIQEAQGTLSSSLEPTALKGAVNKIFDLLSDRFNAETGRWTAAGNKIDKLHALDPQSVITLNRVGRQDIVNKIQYGSEGAAPDMKEYFRQKYGGKK